MASSSSQTRGCVLHTSIKINCAFSRVAFRELSKENPNQRVTQFKQLFCEYPGFHLSDSYFMESNGKKNPSQFERDCSRINDAFSSKWHPPAARLQYECQFSTTKWKGLSSDQKQKHSLSKCEACFVQFLQYQKLFPLKPLFEPESLLHIDMHDVERLKEKEFVKLALQELDKICSENFNKSFKDGLLKHAKAGIQKRPTPTERKREKRAVLRECRNAINKQFADTAAKTVLTEDESLSSYQRKRLSQSFEKPPEAKRHKSHSPNFDRVEWDKEKVITDLKQYPKDKPINWSQFAKEHDVPGSNGGQVVKQYAQQNGIDTIALDNRSPDRRLRSQHKRMPGGEVSIPCNPTPKSIKKSWSDMIESGELSLGEPCTPYTLSLIHI